MRDNFRQGSKVEEQTPKALMAIDGVGLDWSFMGNEQEDHALVADEEVPTEFALMAKTNAESEVFDNSLCSKNCLAQLEGRLAEFKKQEIKFCEKIRGLELQLGFKNDRIESLTNELELLKKEKGELETKLTGFLSASKDLDSLLESQRLDKNKEGLGYSVVPPPPAQVYSPPKKDMSWIGLPEFVDDTTKPSLSTISPKPFSKFVKAADRSTETKTTKVETAKPTVKYAVMNSKPSKSYKVRGNQRNWKNLKSHQLGANFVMKKKAWYNCGGYWDSGFSRHMIGNISYLTDYKPFDGGYVSFGQGGCKITGKGTIKTGKLEFENVYLLGIKCTRHSHCQERVPTGSISSHCQWRVFPLPEE
nr:ribonuclease H-like domain-containing protein [Tanacetum cinerariifolium]